MPELPEVETIGRQLNKALKGRVVAEVRVLREKSFSGDPKILKRWKIESVRRKSKVLEFHFEHKEEIVIVHLKMTGQLIFVDGKKRIIGGHPSPDWVNELPSKHTRVVWTFKDGSKLFFNDMRVFGWMKMINKKEYENEARRSIPDIIDPGFTLEYLFDLLKKTKKAVKLVLLDQEKIGGLGNIYVNDALFLAGIRPDREANSLNKKETGELREATLKVINLGIKYGGASASNYVQVSGLGGTYQDHFLVYKKDGQKCLRCGGVIRKIKLGGRGTYFCPGCQK
jgi:formamidopyrimidine-DNA glycosylase